MPHASRLGRALVVAAEQPAKTPQEALKDAEAKLEMLQESNEAPKSYADLGLKPEVPEPPAVPAFVTAAPPVLIAFSAALVLLNNFGAFGEGPDMDAIIEWANNQ